MKMPKLKDSPGFIVSVLFHLVIILAPVSIMVVEGHNNNTVELLITGGDFSTLPKRISKVPQPELKPAMPSHTEEYRQPRPEGETAPVSLETQAVDTAVSSNTDNITPESNVTTSAAPADVQASTGTPNMPVTVAFGSNSGPAFMHRESPHYPLLARRMGKEGKVILRLTIDEKGNLQNIEVVKGESHGFTEAAVKAVKTSTFRPAMKKGKPVPSSALLPINFVLKDG